MPDFSTATQWQGRTMIGADGDKLGTINDLYVDTATGQPEWALVSTGLLGTKQTFVPLHHANEQGNDIQVPYTKDQIKQAPTPDASGELAQQDERWLYEHYGLDYSTSASPSGLGTAEPGVADTDAWAERDTSGWDERDTRGWDERDTAPSRDDAMTRSEEELRVGTTRQERGRARLRKYVVTEPAETTVPLQREQVRLEREPITDANLDEAMQGPELTESEHEVVLTEEQPVAEKQVVPKERVRLGTETGTDEQQVGEELRKERIEYQGEDPDDVDPDLR